MKKYLMNFIVLTAMAAFLLTGCTEAASEEKIKEEAKEAADLEIDPEPDAAEEDTQKPEILHFVDVYQNPYQVKINPNVEKHNYKDECFIRSGDLLSYIGDDNYTYRLGVDVSEHQGYVDWQQLKDSGFSFAFIRLGYRGYGQEGNIRLDQEFHRNMENAQAAGFDVGVYFFAQAVNEEGVYTESILDDEARTDNVTGEQFTKNTQIFCAAMANAGYSPMIYANMLWEAFELDLEYLSEYPLWYADYEPYPQTPYHFDFWQYTNEGDVPGIEGRADLNIQLIPRQ